MIFSRYFIIKSLFNDNRITYLLKIIYAKLAKLENISIFAEKLHSKMYETKL